MVEITMESSYSGEFCKTVKKWMEIKKRTNKEINFKLNILGATEWGKKAEWGAFTKSNAEQFRQYCTREERNRYHRKYCLEFGKTTFDSKSTFDKNFKEHKNNPLFSFPIYTNFTYASIMRGIKKEYHFEKDYKE